MSIHVANEADFKADLYGRIPGDGEVEMLMGNTSFGDQSLSVWQYDASSAAADNYAGGVIQPTLQSGNGRWIRRWQLKQADWTQATTTSEDYIKNKPTLAAVATTGAYSDLTGKPAIPSTTRTTSTLSLSLVGTGATGTQIDASKDSTVRLTCSTSTTSTIGGPSTSVVLLKTCATNDGTEGNWTTVATLENDQTITLAIALQSIAVVKGQLCADVPAGFFVKLVNSGTGTHSESFVSGQKTIYG